MSAEKTIAIVLRSVEFSESSYISTLFTESAGKITALAKGARRPKSAFENALDLLSISRVVFLRKSSDAMDLLTEAKLERRFRAAARDLTRLYAAYYVIELLNALTGERDPNPRLFRISQHTLVSLDGNGDVGLDVLRFELALLHSMGQVPVLDRCIECGQQLGESRRMAFGQLAGGALCSKCRPGHRHVASLSQFAVKTMQQMIKDIDADAEFVRKDRLLETTHDLENEATEKLAPAVRGELRGLMNHRMSHLLGRRPRTSLKH